MINHISPLLILSRHLPLVQKWDVLSGHVDDSASYTYIAYATSEPLKSSSIQPSPLSTPSHCDKMLRELDEQASRGEKERLMGKDMRPVGINFGTFGPAIGSISKFGSRQFKTRMGYPGTKVTQPHTLLKCAIQLRVFIFVN
jgi:hypothetical protein